MIREAHAQSGGRSLPARVVPGGDDFAGFAFAHPLGPGPLRLHVAYQGKMPEKESGGLFRRHAGSDWYAFTQFEPIDARRAFPCFDEPGFKQPWQLTLHVPKTVTALSNTPIAAETDEAEGMKQVRFAATKPLPSYLVAFAVGPFESVAAGKAGMRGTPIRVITPRGRAKEAHYAAQTAPQLLALLERCFGIPYPFDKLDLLAVPDFPMAMENPGLIWARPAPRRRPGRSRSLSSTRRAGTRSAPAPSCARPVRSGRWPARAAPTGSSPMRDRPAIIASSTGAICWLGSCGPAPPSRWRSARAW